MSASSMKAVRCLQRTQRGFVLVSSLLLLLVVTMLAVSMFRSYGIQEKIAGNVREKQRALQAAQAAEQYAETWLQSNATITGAVACAAGLLNANLGNGQICTNSIYDITGSSATTVPWQANGADVGVTYTPYGTGAAQMNVSTTAAADTYYAAPRFHIQDRGISATAGQGEIYEISAVGYGGTASTVAVVQSTFSVYTSSYDPSK
jgi:type IV pilus assembly protein PilX